MNRVCHACAQACLEHQGDQAIRGGVLEHWHCTSCDTRVEVVGLGTAVMAAVLAVVLVGVALFSNRFSGSATSVLLARAFVGGMGVFVAVTAVLRRVHFERRSPAAPRA